LRKKENKIRICSKQEENRIDRAHATKHIVLAIASSETNYFFESKGRSSAAQLRRK
jgi:hypothetical protein